MRKLMLVVLILSGCARAPITEISPEFKPFVDDFISLYGQDVSGVIIEFSSLNGIDGSCVKKSGGQLIIKINKVNWDNYCPGQRRGIMFHELGHCIMGRPHTNNQMSYMFPETRECEFYIQNIPALDRELFL